ncbi:MAG TPA: DNA helicase RecQ [Lactobacillaceae bacterium]|jgi:ATP-dependent DNA helicase RecQ
MQALEILKNVYGYDAFREGQQTIIDNVLAGKRTLGIMPTGGGKSLTYQIPAQILPGVTMVISPLISLMANQVAELHELGVPTALINSTLDYNERRARLDGLARGEYKLFYVAPEALNAPDMREILANLNLSLVVIDEVHVMSQWGHDFRPSYLSLVDFLADLPQNFGLVALTATATDRVREDLERLLSIEETVQTSAARDNLTLKIERNLSTAEKRRFVADYVREHAGATGIIYANTRKNVDELTHFLREAGVRVAGYHAGMTSVEREASQQAFLYDQVDVIVATNAFGMGINKSNVRYVLHVGMPGSIEAYYQEIGRAGRDGLPSEAILLYSGQDIILRSQFIQNSQGDAAHKQQEIQKLQEMANYAATTMCLPRYILQYFGEDMADCGHCSNDMDTRELVDVTADAQKTLANAVRMKNLRQQAYSKTTMANVLHGSVPENQAWQGFDQLSTYGLLADTPVTRIGKFIDALVADGYLTVVNAEFRSLDLTSRGVEVLRGEQVLMRDNPLLRAEKTRVAKTPMKKAAVADLATEQMPLFEHLRTVRLALARENGVPPFVIFPDTTLVALAQNQPKTLADMQNVPGIGEKKLAQYGQIFLEALGEFDAVN